LRDDVLLNLGECPDPMAALLASDYRLVMLGCIDAEVITTALTAP